MRTIKFRGKDLNSGEWLYGDLVHSADKKRSAILVSDCDCYDECEVDPATVGQFTGLLDCNGNEIYEGDILRIGIYPTREEAEANQRNARLMNVELPSWVAGGDIIARVSYFDCAFHVIHLQSYLPGCDNRTQEPMLNYLFYERHPDVYRHFDQTLAVIGNIHDNPEMTKSSQQ